MTDKATTPPLTGAELDKPAFEVWAREACNMPPGVPLNWDAVWTKSAYEGWQAAASIAQARAQQESAAAPELSDLETYPSPHGTLVRLADVKCRISSQPPAPVVVAEPVYCYRQKSRDQYFSETSKENWEALKDSDAGKGWYEFTIRYTAPPAPPAPTCHAPASTADAMRMWDALPDAKPAAAPEAAHADDAPMRCHCVACRDGLAHASDCAVHNEPAEANGPCNCEASAHAQQDAAPQISRTALAEFIDGYCAGRSDLISLAEAAFYWFNKCLASASVPSDATGKADAANAGGLEVAYNRAKFSRSVVREDFEAGWNAATSAADAKDAEQIMHLCRVAGAGLFPKPGARIVFKPHEGCAYCEELARRTAIAATTQAAPASSEFANREHTAQAATVAKGEPGPWNVLGIEDMPDRDRKLDVVLTNGVTECDRAYSQIDWTQVADWRYSQAQSSANNGEKQ